MLKMRKPKGYKNYKNQKSPKKNVGFYIALSICMVTVAAAAWTTYGSVMDYSELAEESSEQSAEVKVDKDVSGEKYESQAEASDDSDEESIESLAEESEDFDDDSEESDEPGAEPPQNLQEESEETVETAVDTSRTSPIEKGKIIKKFSPNNPIQSKTMSDWRTHSGVDISASKGTPVRAITGGTVKMIYKDALLGNVIAVEHTGGFTAYYCGLTDTPVVKTGNIVSTGDTIGYVGTVPGEILDESHLHLEIKSDSDLIDPTTIF